VDGLFDSQTEKVFCPYDGHELADSKWVWCNRRLRACPDGHVWEVCHNAGWKKSVEFSPIEMVRCRCSTPTPKLLMNAPPDKNVKTPPLCPDCYDVVKKAWRPDPEASHAHLIISPIRLEEGLYFKYETRVAINPYPNPHGCGGWLGGGGAKNEGELVNVVTDFKLATQFWQDLGVKAEVIRKPERTPTEDVNERIVARTQEKTKEEPQLKLLV